MTHRSEGLRFARSLMVIGSFAPLFLLWAIQGPGQRDGNDWVSYTAWAGVCLALAICPNLVLWLRLRIAARERDVMQLSVISSEDHRGHLLTYLFATLLPFYTAPIESPRQLCAVVVGLMFVLFLCWRMNLHYMNVAFAAAGYNVYTVDLDGPVPRKAVLLTKRSHLGSHSAITALRLSDTVFLEQGVRE